MSVALVGLAIVVVAGGVVAVSVRGSRLAIAGWSAAGAAAPLILDGGLTAGIALPAAARVVAALLAGYLLWIAVRGGAETRGSLAGWPSDALLACAGAVAGAAVVGLATGGPREATMAGFALAALAIGPLLLGRDALRLGLGLLLAVQAAGLIRVGLIGAPGAAEQLALAGLTVALGAAAAALAAGAIRATGGLTLVPSRRPSAHLPTSRAGGTEPPPSVSTRSARTKRPRKSASGPG